MSDAVDKLIQARRKRLGKVEIDAESLRLAAECAPTCAEALFDQVESDLRRFEEEVRPLSARERAKGVLLFGSKDEAEFSLRLELSKGAQPLIHCRQSIRKNRDAANEPRLFDIHVVGDGRGYCSYRLKDKEEGIESTSASLLAPLFDLF